MNITIYIAICSTFALLIYLKFQVAELEKRANNLECELKNIKTENINLKNSIAELNCRFEYREVEIDKKIESKFESYRKRELARRSGIIMD